MADPQINQDALEHVAAYHQTTKHHPRRYARSLGYMDWATQPNPFRRYDGAPLLTLPVPEVQDAPAYDDVYTRTDLPSEPLTRDSISRFLYLSLAISAWKQAGSSQWALRVNPSSGNLHPTEGYLLLPPVSGLTNAPGLFHYAPREHALEMRAAWSEELGSRLTGDAPPGAFLVGLSSICWRETWKYGERAFRYTNHDVGHALATLRLAAAVLGWRMSVMDELSDADAARLLGLDRTAEFPDDEPEHPDLLAWVYPSQATPPTESIADEVIRDTQRIETLGRPNRLSVEHAAHWDIIDDVAKASAKPRTTFRSPPNLAAQPRRPLRPARAANPLPSERIIRQRRSGVAFDGQTLISADTFFAMLARTLPRDEQGTAFPPWDAAPWPPRIHLGLFVHRVDGITPGVYAFLRDPAKMDLLREAFDPDFAWARPENCPAEVPLFLLLEADCRQAAATLSLGQDIAGMSAFSLGMLAEFDAALEAGPWMYRRLFWEAGMVGQVLYLEAEAAGVRSTGIGAYFDDPVHEVFGIRDRRLQSLYHFTVGGAVDDPRLTTLSAYPPLE